MKDGYNFAWMKDGFPSSRLLDRPLLTSPFHGVIKISVADLASGALIRERKKIQIRDPDRGSRINIPDHFQNPIRDPDLGSRINISDHISLSFVTIFGLKIL